jgi:CCT motif
MLDMGDLLRIQEGKRYERQFKIERYKNKRRNWIRKISYDCRKRVADSRLRVKGRFISKKDSEILM